MPITPASIFIYCLKSLLALAMYIGAAGIGLEMVLWENHSPLIWPPAGLGLAIVLLGGQRYVWVVAVGAFSISVSKGEPLLAASLLGFLYAGATSLTVYVLRQVVRFNHSLESIRDVTNFLLIAVAGMPAITALTSVLLDRYLPGSSAPFIVEGSKLFNLWGVRWLGDALGVLVLAPALTVWASKTRINWRNTQAVEVLTWLAILIFIGAMVFRNWAPSDTLRYPLELTMFPLMAWAAVRFGQRGATTGNVIVAIMAVWELREVIGPEATRFISQPPGYLWVFVGVLAITSLLLAAVLTENRLREDRIRSNEERLRAFIEALPDLAFIIDENGRHVEVFAPAGKAWNEWVASARDKTFEELWPAYQAEEFRKLVAEVLRENTLRIIRYPMTFEGEMRFYEGRIAPMATMEEYVLRGVVWVAYDITEMHRTQEALRARDRMLGALTDADEILLRSKDLHEGAMQALETLGSRSGLDRIYLLREQEPIEMKDVGVEVFAVWQAEEFGHLDLLQDERQPWLLWMDCLRTNRNRDRCFHLNESDLVAVSLKTDAKECWGYLVFQWMTPQARGVDAYTQTLLASFAASMSGFIEARRFEQDIISARQDAVAANLAKSQFLAMMSHEIRTPMNAILGYADVLAQSPLSLEQKDHLRIISQRGRDLLTMINEILDFSKLESSSVELDNVPFNLESVVIEALELMLVKAREKQLALEYELNTTHTMHYQGDPIRIRQVLINLLSNAIKFTPRGRVFLKVTVAEQDETNHKICFAVEDTGIGIPKDKRHLLFQPFTQLDSSTTREFGGTGLGLSICKRLVERMNGAIRVKSEVGEGSTFYFTITLPSTVAKMP